jgi:hypothetical protein
MNCVSGREMNVSVIYRILFILQRQQAVEIKVAVSHHAVEISHLLLQATIERRLSMASQIHCHAVCNITPEYG